MELKKFILILAVAFGATAGTVSEGTVKVQPLTNHYTVKSGDTLSGIAHELYGRASAWKDLQNANSALIKNENLINPGMVITYSVEAAQQSMAQVLRAKEFRKLAGKSAVVTSKNTKTQIKKTFIKRSIVMGSVPFGPAPLAKKSVVHHKNKKLAVRKVASVQPVVQSVQPAPVKKATKKNAAFGLNGFKDLEI